MKEWKNKRINDLYSERMKEKLPVFIKYLWAAYCLDCKGNIDICTLVQKCHDYLISNKFSVNYPGRYKTGT
jgi:hypothetical protein